ncbi:MAG: response regulator [Bdellovibrionales bacterium]|nr:response regulator [Bdellovibrionales bacterium]
MKKRILVVDDNPDIRMVVQTVLEANDYFVDTAEDGDEALEFLNDAERVSQLTAIILDILMPRLNGLEVLKKLRTQVHTRNVPVIMLTTEGLAQDIIKGYNEGAQYYIPKPFTSQQLLYGLNLVLEDGKDPLELELEKKIAELE